MGKVLCCSKLLSDICPDEKTTLKTHLLAMILNRIQRANVVSNCGNNLQIRPIRPKKLTDGTTPHGDLSLDTLFAEIRQVVSEKIWGLNYSDFYSSPFTLSKQTKCHFYHGHPPITYKSNSYLEFKLQATCNCIKVIDIISLPNIQRVNFLPRKHDLVPWLTEWLFLRNLETTNLHLKSLMTMEYISLLRN